LTTLFQYYFLFQGNIPENKTGTPFAIIQAKKIEKGGNEK